MPGPVNPTGEDILRLATHHLHDRYILGSLAPKDNPNWHGPWDCAELASWLIFQVSGMLYGCESDYGDPATANAYTGYWARDADAVGRRIVVGQAANTPGAAVLRVPQAGAMGHIVISDGQGGTVEAHSSRDGVIRSTLANRRWDFGILVPGIQYTQGPPAGSVTQPEYVIYRLTDPRMVDDVVAEIQRALRVDGEDPGDIDSEFGPHTQAAVVAFQLKNGLAPDGEVGPITAAALGVTLTLVAEPSYGPH